MSKRVHLQFLKSNKPSKCKVNVNEECLQGPNDIMARNNMNNN